MTTTPSEGHTALRIAFVPDEYNRPSAKGNSPGSLKLWDADGWSWYLATVEDVPKHEEYIAEVVTAVNERASLLARLRRMEEALTNAEAVMSIVEPRADKAEYLQCLTQIRAALSEQVTE